MKINNVDYLNVPQQINKNKLDIKDLNERVLTIESTSEGDLAIDFIDVVSVLALDTPYNLSESAQNLLKQIINADYVNVKQKIFGIYCVMSYSTVSDLYVFPSTEDVTYKVIFNIQAQQETTTPNVFHFIARGTSPVFAFDLNFDYNNATDTFVGTPFITATRLKEDNPDVFLMENWSLLGTKTSTGAENDITAEYLSNVGFQNDLIDTLYGKHIIRVVTKDSTDKVLEDFLVSYEPSVRNPNQPFTISTRIRSLYILPWLSQAKVQRLGLIDVDGSTKKIYFGFNCRTSTGNKVSFYVSKELNDLSIFTERAYSAGTAIDLALQKQATIEQLPVIPDALDEHYLDDYNITTDIANRPLALLTQVQINSNVVTSASLESILRTGGDELVTNIRYAKYVFAGTESITLVATTFNEFKFVFDNTAGKESVFGNYGLGSGKKYFRVMFAIRTVSDDAFVAWGDGYADSYNQFFIVKSRAETIGGSSTTLQAINYYLEIYAVEPFVGNMYVGS